MSNSPSKLSHILSSDGKLKSQVIELVQELHAWFQQRSNSVAHARVVTRLGILLYVSIVVKSVRKVLGAIKWLLAPHLVIQILLRHTTALFLLLFVPRLAKAIRPIWRTLFTNLCLLLIPLLKVPVVGPLLARAGLDGHVHREKLELFRKLGEASSLKEWIPIAQELDRIEGKLAWKKDPPTPSMDFDFKKIERNTRLMRELREKSDVLGLRDHLRTRLLRNLGNIQQTKLYQRLRYGTKQAIEDYHQEVVRCLKYLRDTNIDGVSLPEKLEFFSQTRHSFGRSALLLSGGAALGMWHSGVVKALMEANCLPRIISGSSVGSLFAAFIGTRTDDELWKLIANAEIDLSFFPAHKGAFGRRMRRFVNTGVVLDIDILSKCIEKNLGELTFLEAYERTGRVLNITVTTPSESSQSASPRLLNYLTAPDVLIWTAACASCAIPFIYKPVELQMRRNGVVKPYDLKGIKFTDGSVSHDLPIQRLAELFNVNHFIVSQCNPHVIPFIQPFSGPKTGYWLEKLFRYLGRQSAFTLLSLWDLNILQRFGGIRNLLYQPYEGDITFVAQYPFREYRKILSNPTPEHMLCVTSRSQRKAWRRTAELRAACDIEFCLDDCVRFVRGELIAANVDSLAASRAASRRPSVEVGASPTANSVASPKKLLSPHLMAAARGDDGFEAPIFTLSQPNDERQLSFGNRISSWTPEAFVGYQDRNNPSEFRVSVNIADEAKSDSQQTSALPTPTQRERKRAEITYLQSRSLNSFDYVGSSTHSARSTLPPSGCSSIATTPHHGGSDFPPSLSLPNLAESLMPITETSEESDDDSDGRSPSTPNSAPVGSRSADSTPSQRNESSTHRSQSRTPRSFGFASTHTIPSFQLPAASAFQAHTLPHSKSMSLNFGKQVPPKPAAANLARRVSTSDLALPASFSLTERCTDNAAIP